VSEDDDTELVALVAQEQRGLRTIMIWGFSALFLVVAMSAALGVYYYFVAQTIAADSERLQKRAFETRILADDLANRIADQEAALRRSYADMLSIAKGDTVDASEAAVFETARDFLERGVRSLAGEQRLEAAVAREPGGARGAFYRGVLNLLEWERSGQAIARGAEALPPVLEAARSAFTAAREDGELRPLAQEGLAWIAFEDASSSRSNYAIEDCESVFAATEAIGPVEGLGPLPLYWRGQCARKLGRVDEALRNYSLAVRASQDAAGGVDAETDTAEEEAVLTLRLNALHGLGTVLIAAANTSAGEAMTPALALAREACNGDGTGPGSAQTRPMYACLEKAMALRSQLRQTPNQISGTRENLSFVYLIDNDFDGALGNVMAVEGTGLFAWNELVRAFVASEAGALAAAEDARRNVALFEADEFNICEIATLMKPAHYDAAFTIFREEHPGFTPDCD